MKKTILTACLLAYFGVVLSQTLATRLHDAYDTFKEKTIADRRSFKHHQLSALVEKLKKQDKMTVSEVGQSFEKRGIFQVKYGTGKKTVLLWSQMHGDESTATMAIFDMFNFLTASGDGFDDFRKKLAEKTTLYFVPMLNPDGAERWQRRTAQEIDMNRDALRLVCPESEVLKRLQNTYKPDFAFNLHDQNSRLSAGPTPHLATLSFLATAYDYPLSINAVRKNSMRLIVGMNKVLQQFIPNQVARYSDEHEPRAFGDNIQKWGSSLILIESGGYKNDPEKQYIRKLNFITILTGLNLIANGEVSKEKYKDYFKLPENDNYHFDLIVRNAQISLYGKTYKTDIGINRREINNETATHFTYRSDIADFGDLSIFHGIEELDAKGALVTDKDGNNITLKPNVSATFLLKKGNEIVFSIENGFVK